MDSQRSLFKKFFNAGSSSSNGGTGNKISPSISAGFNPPKFHFNKKKFGAIDGLKTGNISVSMSEIESVEIDGSNCDETKLDCSSDESSSIDTNRKESECVFASVNVPGHPSANVYKEPGHRDTSASQMDSDIREIQKQKYNIS